MSKRGYLEVDIIAPGPLHSVLQVNGRFLKVNNVQLVDNPEDAWSLAKKIATDCEGSYTPQELYAIFGYVTIDEIFDKFSYDEVRGKCFDWDWNKHAIKRAVEDIAPGVLISLFDLEDCVTEDDVLEAIILSYSEEEVKERVSRLEQCSEVDSLLQSLEESEIREIFGIGCSKPNVISHYLRGELSLDNIKQSITKYKRSKILEPRRVCINRDTGRTVVVIKPVTEVEDVYEVLDLQTFELLLCHENTLTQTDKMFSFEE